MKITFSFLFAATVLGLAACLPQNLVYLSYNNGPNSVISTWDSQGSHIETVNQNIGSIPLQWTAELVNSVNRPSQYSISNFLSLLDNPQSWILKPYSPDSRRTFASWNVRIRLPVQWRSNIILQSSRLDNDYYANCLLNTDNAGVQIIPSHSGNIPSNSSSELLEIDLSIPMSLTYRNNKLTVGFTARRVQV